MFRCPDNGIGKGQAAERLCIGSRVSLAPRRFSEAKISEQPLRERAEPMREYPVPDTEDRRVVSEAGVIQSKVCSKGKEGRG